LGALGEGLAKVGHAIQTGEFSAGAAPIRKQGVDRFHVPLAIGLFLLVAESLLGTRRRFRPGVGMLVAFMFIIPSPAFSATNSVVSTNQVAKPEPVLKTARDHFQAGTARLQEGKLREAEGYLQNALALQEQQAQPATLYNLGHVRYQMGIEELKKSPDAAAAAQRALGALDRGDQALREGRSALESENIQRMVQAYLDGRGARRGLREATDQVRRAMEAHGVALQKWQRALGDFKSALELNPDDADAKRNIEILEEAIAKLIDKIRALQQLGQIMGQQMQALGALMKQLRGKMPAPDAPPGAGEEDEEEDEEGKNGPQEGQKEGRSRDGQTIRISREEAGWILEAFKLGGDRRLPMGQGEEKKPKDQKGKDW